MKKNCAAAVIFLLVVFVAGVVATEPPKPEPVAHYTFEWIYKSRGALKLVVRKTENGTELRMHTYEHSDACDSIIYPKYLPGYIEALRAGIAAYEKLPPKERRKEGDYRSFQVGDYLTTIKQNAQWTDVIHIKYSPKNGLIAEESPLVGGDLTIENADWFMKYLPSLPAAMKQVDERIGAAVK